VIRCPLLPALIPLALAVAQGRLPYPGGAISCPPGTTRSRVLARGPRIPWYRTRWKRGGGIRATSFSTSSISIGGAPPRGFDMTGSSRA
jgi:hypothetical protein